MTTLAELIEAALADPTPSCTRIEHHDGRDYKVTVLEPTPSPTRDDRLRQVNANTGRIATGRIASRWAPMAEPSEMVAFVWSLMGHKPSRSLHVRHSPVNRAPAMISGTLDRSRDCDLHGVDSCAVCNGTIPDDQPRGMSLHLGQHPSCTRCRSYFKAGIDALSPV